MARTPSCSSSAIFFSMCHPCDGVELQPTSLTTCSCSCLGYQSIGLGVLAGAMAAPAWKEELASIVRLHISKGTLVMGWEMLQERLVELGLANKLRAIPEFKRSRGSAQLNLFGCHCSFFTAG